MVVSGQPHFIAALPSGGTPLHFFQGPKADPGALNKRKAFPLPGIDSHSSAVVPWHSQNSDEAITASRI
jgi:hypothetical protein